jgi:hypothetical protein
MFDYIALENLAFALDWKGAGELGFHRAPYASVQRFAILTCGGFGARLF